MDETKQTSTSSSKEPGKSKPKLNKLDKYLIASFITLLTYTVASLVLFALRGEEAATLTVAFFGCFGGEVFACALLKSLKIKHKEE